MSATSLEAKARRAISKKAYYEANKDRLAALNEGYSKAYYLANKDKIKGYMRSVRSSAEYKAKERERRAKEREAEAPQREARRMDREAIIQRVKAEREALKIERMSIRSAAVAARKDEMKARRYARAKAWKVANKERHASSQAIYMAEYIKTDAGKLNRKTQRSKPRNKMIHNQRKRLREFVKQTGSRVHLRFGCSADFMRAHIEKQFTRGMTWDNYGEWHIDHIMPCAQFDLSNQMHADICFNWQNLRPLWADENHAKSDTVTHPQLCLPIAA